MVGSKLTEQLVEARSKCSDFHQVVKLNVWGNDLEDISLCLKMPNLEVLSLSVNSIRSLAGLQNCHKLKELYLRGNQIEDISELDNLLHATQLTSLWLEGNPFADAAGKEYRATVLRMMPQLKKLDNVEVSHDELQAALKHKSFTLERQEEPPQPVVVNPKGAAARRRHEEEQERGREACRSNVDNIGLRRPQRQSSLNEPEQPDILSGVPNYSPRHQEILPRGGVTDAGSFQVASTAASIAAQARRAAGDALPRGGVTDTGSIQGVSVASTIPAQARRVTGQALSRGGVTDGESFQRVSVAGAAASVAVSTIAAQALETVGEPLPLGGVGDRNILRVTSSDNDGRLFESIVSVTPLSLSPPQSPSLFNYPGDGASALPNAQNTNVLAGALILIRDMNDANLIALGQAIQDQLRMRNSQPPTNK